MKTVTYRVWPCLIDLESRFWTKPCALWAPDRPGELLGLVVGIDIELLAYRFDKAPLYRPDTIGPDLAGSER